MLTYADVCILVGMVLTDKLLQRLMESVGENLKVEPDTTYTLTHALMRCVCAALCAAYALRVRCVCLTSRRTCSTRLRT